MPFYATNRSFGGENHSGVGHYQYEKRMLEEDHLYLDEQVPASTILLLTAVALVFAHVDMLS